MGFKDFGDTPGAGDANATYTGGYVFYDADLPAGRRTVDGRFPVLVTGFTFVANGRGAGRTIVASASDGGNGNRRSSVGIFVGAASRAQDWQRASVYKPFELGGESGRAVRIILESNGLFYHGRNTRGPGTVYGDSGLARAGSLAGGFFYSIAPESPQWVSLTPSADGRVARVVCTPRDDGGAGIKRYTIQWALDSGFTQGVAEYSGPSLMDIIGLEPGRRYWWRWRASNETTDAIGSPGSEWSPSVSATQPRPSGVRVFDGTRMVNGRAMVWNGTMWVPAVVRAYANGRWQEAR
jgi:hypothetical protein